MRVHSTLSSLLAFALFGLASLPAYAQSTCSADSECVKGWTCQVSGGTACAAPACAPGEKCEQQPIDCVNEEYRSCQPGPCRVDSDCADGMVCYTHTESDCAPSACAPGQECPTPACESKTESACVPRYVLPCSTASDCGDGFQCESAGEQCSCSGSAGSSDSASDGGAPTPAPQEPDCVCEPSKELRCHAATVNCTADSDCPADWSCAAIAVSGGCANAPASNASSGAGAQGGGAAAPDCRPAADVKQCVPPYYSLIQGAHGVDRDAAGSPTLGYGGRPGSADSGSAIPPKAESGSDDASSSAGCSVAYGSRAGSALAVFGALGLFGALRRRRAR